MTAVGTTSPVAPTIPAASAAFPVLLPASWIAFACSVFFRPDRGQFNPWLDAGLYNVPFCIAAAACLLRSGRPVIDSTGWRTLGTGLIVFTAGNVYGTLVVGEQEIFPSPADALWLAFYVLAYVAIVQMVRQRMTRFHASSWLDGGVGGLGAAALVVAFALGPTLSMTKGRLGVVATTLAYPTADVILIVILVTAGVALRQFDLSFCLLIAGFTVFAITDVMYLFKQSAGTYAEGGVLDIFWPLAAIIIGLSACVRGPVRLPTVASGPRLIFPLVFTTSSIGLLTFGQRHSVSTVAVSLALSALVVASVRVAITFREVQNLARSRVEARTDELTGLANRRNMMECLASAVGDRADPAALLMIDLDNFKEINDSLGHAAGDHLLLAVGRRFQLIVPNDSLLARLGGDEFAILINTASSEQAAELGRRLRDALHDPFEIEDTRVTIDASIGIAVAPDHADTAPLLLSRADIAMFRAKRLRTGVELFSADIDTASPDRLALLTQLRAAFEKGQFVLHYQPQRELRSGDVVGVEALVRWNHPERGLVPPDLFLPLIDQANLMTELTRYVLRQAVSDCADLHESGFSLRFSVNVSASDLIGEDLPELVAELLHQHRLDASAIAVEITENSIMTDRVRSLATLHRLRALGVHLSVDDYGTGQASLSYVRDLPISELKLDRAFLQGVPRDKHNSAIIRSTIELAHALGLPIVAEGVEDDAALAFLGELGCDLGQGFHIARPLPFDELCRWLETVSASRFDTHSGDLAT